MNFLHGFVDVIDRLNRDEIAAVILQLRDLKARGGRLFFLGVGGSAANASHAVNDFRKIAHIESYAPTDNVAELTAWTNDVSWGATFEMWLSESRFTAADAIFVLSVGGGSEFTSQNLVRAMAYVNNAGGTILGIVGRDGGATRRQATACVLVPTIDDARITPYCESAQSLLLHLLATDPALQV